jgi:hypothetical protein
VRAKSNLDLERGLAGNGLAEVRTESGSDNYDDVWPARWESLEKHFQILR